MHARNTFVPTCGNHVRSDGYGTHHSFIVQSTFRSQMDSINRMKQQAVDDAIMLRRDAIDGTFAMRDQAIDDVLALRQKAIDDANRELDGINVVVFCLLSHISKCQRSSVP